MIDAENISKTYPRGEGGAVEALKKVSFQIAPGEFVVVRGASGSGKSTLLNLLGCLDRPSSGRYRLASFCRETRNPLTEADSAARSRIGMISLRPVFAGKRALG